MDNKTLARIIKALAGPSERSKRRRKEVSVAQPRPPAHWLSLFQGFRPPYQYNSGVQNAYFVKVVQWREAGPWCGAWVGIYQTEMSGGGETWAERYFWGFKNGEFREVKQHGVRGIRKRLLRG